MKSSDDTNVDVCVLCAQAEEAKAFRTIVERLCNVSFDKAFGDPITATRRSDSTLWPICTTC